MKNKILILINALATIGLCSAPIMAKKNIIHAEDWKLTLSDLEYIYTYDETEFSGDYEYFYNDDGMFIFGVNSGGYEFCVYERYGFAIDDFDSDESMVHLLYYEDSISFYVATTGLYILSYSPINSLENEDALIPGDWSDFIDFYSDTALKIDTIDLDEIKSTNYEQGYDEGYQEALDYFYAVPGYQYNFYDVYDVYNVNYVNDYLLPLSAYNGFPSDLTINGVDYDYIGITFETEFLNVLGFHIIAANLDDDVQLELAYYNNNNLRVENVYEGLILVNSIQYYSSDEIIDLTGLNPYISAFYGTFLKGVDNAKLENYISQQQSDIEYWMNYASEEANSIYNTGYETGYSNGLETGYSNGYDEGYDDGYGDGFIAGTDNPEYNDVWGFLGSLFVGLAPILEIELFGFLPIGYLIAIPIIFAIFAFILGLFR